jgi:hypothetical protein
MENEVYYLSRLLVEFEQERVRFTTNLLEFEKLKSNFIEIHISKTDSADGTGSGTSPINSFETFSST